MIRTLIVDDDVLFRAGLRMILDASDGITVVGDAGDGEQALSFVTAHPGEVDLVLMDISMPVLDGVEATRRVVATDHAPRVLVLTTLADDEYVYEALTAGSSGFLLKDTPPEALISSIFAVHAGTAVVSPGLTRRLVETSTTRATGPVAARLLADLTDKETEVLTLMGRGLTNGEIAEHLVIAEVTVKTHVGRILRKIGARDRVQAVITAYESGLVDAELS